MQELKKKILAAHEQVQNDWVTALKEAEKTGNGVDLTAIVTSSTKFITAIDAAFSDFEQRHRKDKRWFQ